MPAELTAWLPGLPPHWTHVPALHVDGVPVRFWVTADGAVLAVESDARAVRDAARNLADRPQVEIRRGKVDRALRPLVRQDISADVVVLDPPRTGAGRGICTEVARLGARVVVYVACDPAALARDVAYLAAVGYRLETLRAFDAFPMTHHVECIAILTPRSD